MKSAFSCAIIVALVGCGGGPLSECKSVSCPAGSATYQSCGEAGGNVSYTFGAAACACNAGDTAGCAQCAQEIASYCGAGGGGSVDGGAPGSDGGGPSPSGDCVPHGGGTTDQFVLDTLVLPQQRTDYAYDLTGSGRPVNQYGIIMGALTQQDLQPQAGVDQALKTGQEVILLSESSSNPQTDSCASASLTPGVSTTFSPTEGATYMAASGGGTFAGPIVAGKLDSAPPATTKMPVSLTLLLPFAGVAPLKVPIVAAHLQFSYAGGRISAGQLNGAIKQSDIDNVLIPATAKTLADKIATDQASGTLTSTDMSILSLFDTGGSPGPMQSGCTTSCATTCQNPSHATNPCACAVSGDIKIDECEVATNSIIKSLFAPDVQLFDANGSYAPNPNPTHKDSLSIGLGFTAIPAHF